MANVLGCSNFVQGGALLAQRLLKLVLGRPVRLVGQEDSESSIAIVRKGWSPKLRTLLRNQSSNLQQLHKLLTADPEKLDGRDPVELRHHGGETNKDDLFTKFRVPCKFAQGLALLGMRRARLPPLVERGAVVDFGVGRHASAKAAALSVQPPQSPAAPPRVSVWEALAPTSFLVVSRRSGRAAEGGSGRASATLPAGTLFTQPARGYPGQLLYYAPLMREDGDAASSCTPMNECAACTRALPGRLPHTFDGPSGVGPARPPLAVPSPAVARRGAGAGITTRRGKVLYKCGEGRVLIGIIY